MRRPGCVRARARGWPLLVTLLAGCTMCPDPYDYSGPVPNGSAPQNDFRARSNGIVPIGTRPRPWPPIVKRDSEPAGPTPTLAQAEDAAEAARIPAVVSEQPLDVAAAFEAAAQP